MSTGSAPKNEIDQILNDIEELQQEMDKNQASESTEADDALSEFRSGATPESSLEDLSDLRDDSSGTSLLDEVASGEEGSEEVVAEEIEIPEELHEDLAEEFTEEVEEQMMDDQDSSAQEGSLTLKLQGQMTLRLQYEFEGQEVTIGFTDGCLKVQLADGTEFKVPVGERPMRPVKLKKVA